MPRYATNLEHDHKTNAELRAIMCIEGLDVEDVAEILARKPFSLHVEIGTVQSWLRSPGTPGYRTLPLDNLGMLKDKLSER